MGCAGDCSSPLAGERVEGHRQRQPVKVAARDDLVGLGEDQRVVGHRPELALEDATDEADGVVDRAEHLGDRP